jgi:peptidoglycan/LPS O-acetylase OafA/YrhL
MGLIRILLAISVVLTHSAAWSSGGYFLGFRPIPGNYAVQAFFLISGFYMELIGSRYAKVPVRVFYVNRYSRIIVSYWIVLFASIALALSDPGNKDITFLHEQGTGIQRIVLGFSNGFAIGLDAIPLFSLNWLSGVVIPQGWSLGTELWFYLLVPLLWNVPTKWLWAVVAVSLGARVAVMALQPDWPWYQRFFPAEIMFFILGMIACRQGRTTVYRPIYAFGALGVLVLFVSYIGWLVPANVPLSAASSFKSVLLGALFFVLVPPVFQISRHSGLDRLIGEYSYPVYLWHWSLMYFIEPANRLWHGGFLLLLCIAASTPIVLLVEIPMERWRNARLKAATFVV